MGLIIKLVILDVLFKYSVCSIQLTTNNTHINECPDYGVVENANVIVFTIGNHHAIHIECNSGYHLIGKHKILCINGRWDDVPRPECKPSLCTSPPEIKNGVITLEGEKEVVGLYRKGTLVTYTCNDGYRLVPPESQYRVCEKSIWTGLTGKCVLLGCKQPKSIDNGYYVRQTSDSINQFGVGQRIFYNCNSGYILNGMQYQTCLEDGTWSPRMPPVCALEINVNDPGELPDGQCQKLPQLLHVRQELVQGSIWTNLDRDVYAQDTEFALRCLSGYMNTESSSCEPSIVRCTAGTWVGVLPNCIPAKECYSPPSVSNAILLGRTISYPIGSYVQYECFEGYVMRGSRQLTCSGNGCWKPTMDVQHPSCQSDTQFLDEYMTPSGTLLVSMATAAGVMLMLLGVCLVVVCRRRKLWSRQPLTQTVGAGLPPHSAVSGGDSTSALINDPDRLALIAFADGIQVGQNSGLPSYEEAIRDRSNGPGSTGLLGYRPHRPHWPTLGVRRGRGPSGPPGETHVTRQSSCTSHSASMRSGSAGDPMGSTDTMTPSEVSTNITLDTVSSHSGSQPASCRAICGSLASFDTSSVLNTEGVPLLEENETEETPSAETGSIGVADNASYKYHRTSPDLA